MRSPPTVDAGQAGCRRSAAARIVLCHRPCPCLWLTRDPPGSCPNCSLDPRAATSRLRVLPTSVRTRGRCSPSSLAYTDALGRATIAQPDLGSDSFLWPPQVARHVMIARSCCRPVGSLPSSLHSRSVAHAALVPGERGAIRYTSIIQNMVRRRKRNDVTWPSRESPDGGRRCKLRGRSVRAIDCDAAVHQGGARKLPTLLPDHVRGQSTSRPPHSVRRLHPRSDRGEGRCRSRSPHIRPSVRARDDSSRIDGRSVPRPATLAPR